MSDGKEVKVWSGLVFTYWTVVAETSNPKLVSCICKCGSVKTVRKYLLQIGKSKSCGCRKAEVNRSRCQKFAGYLTSSKIYVAWKHMISRCYNENDPDFKDYGGRGIFVCDGWRQSFESFAKDMEPAVEGLSLDRINNDGPYSKENCRWTTTRIQNGNTRRKNKTGYVGVKFIDGKYQAYFEIKKRKKYLGTYNTASEAGAAYQNAVRRELAAIERAEGGSR